MAQTPSHKGTRLNDTAIQGRRANTSMPTLFRFLVTLAVLAGIAYGAMFALVMFVEPKKGEITVRIPPEKLAPKK